MNRGGCARAATERGLDILADDAAGGAGAVDGAQVDLVLGGDLAGQRGDEDAVGAVVGALVAVEASGPTWAFVDAIQVHGVDVCVVDTRKTKIKAGYAAKTDKLDARRLADALRRESVVSIYIPPPAIRELHSA